MSGKGPLDPTGGGEQSGGHSAQGRGDEQGEECDQCDETEDERGLLDTHQDSQSQSTQATELHPAATGRLRQSHGQPHQGRLAERRRYQVLYPIRGDKQESLGECLDRDGLFRPDGQTERGHSRHAVGHSRPTGEVQHERTLLRGVL